jgi:phosphohistidine phosphatase SixA
MNAILKKGLQSLAGLAAVLMSSASLATATPVQEALLPGLDSILPQLREGGFVVYLRHAATDLSGPTDEQSDISRCETQRNLSASGREQATGIGKAWQALGIPVGTVLSSPFCRCKDTAKLAFGHFQTQEHLYFSIGLGKEQTTRLATELRRMLGTPPAKGANTVIVAHTANLREAAGIWPKPEGTAYVFKVLPGGEFRAVAKILAEDWTAAARDLPRMAKSK